MKKTIIYILFFGLLGIFSNCSALAVSEGGSWMIPQAKQCLNNGEDKKAYELASKIIENSPNSWEAYKIKAIASANLGKLKEGLDNINKSLKNYHGHNFKEEMELYAIHSSLIFHITFTSSLSPQEKQNNIYSIFNDVDLIASRPSFERGREFFDYFIKHIIATPCSSYYKISVLSSLLSNKEIWAYRNCAHYNCFTIYGVITVVAYYSDNTNFTGMNTTREQILSKIKQKTILKHELDSYDNDLLDLMYYIGTGNNETANMVYQGISQNVLDGYYKNGPNIYSFEYRINRAKKILEDIRHNFTSKKNIKWNYDGKWNYE